MTLVTIDTDRLHWCNMTGTRLGWVNEVDITNAIVSQPCEDAVSREAVLDAIKNNYRMAAIDAIENLPPVTPKPLDNVLNEIRAEIEPKCDRINSLASVLPYTAHREIQELLCEILNLCKAESEGKG